MRSFWTGNGVIFLLSEDCYTQCDSSYGFSVIVRVTVTGFYNFSVTVAIKIN